MSGELAKTARARGHLEASHVVWIGKDGTKDWNLMQVILDGDWTLVTRNADDFRGAADAHGAKGLYRTVELHAGLICLTAPYMSRDTQSHLFEAAMDELERDADLINQVLEVIAETETTEDLMVRRYRLPAE